MKIVDPHVHLWDLSTGLYPWLEKPSDSFIGNNAPIARSYRIEELRAEGHGKFEIAKIVHVEAIPADRVAETRALQAVSDSIGGGFPQGLVVATDLSAETAAQELEQHSACRNVRGVRQILNRHPDPFYNYVDKDYMSDPTWRKNLSLLQPRGLSFDMQLYPHQILQACDVIAQHPGLQFILNHGGMFVDRSRAGWAQWRKGIRALAAFDNVAVKISGLGMFDRAWSVESFRPYVFELIDAFGTKRSMFASNFPVDKLFSTYVALWGAFLTIAADASETEKLALFCENAERVYRI
jgi:predicted TIM-barrel fold metal-dependent hydrolase